MSSKILSLGYYRFSHYDHPGQHCSSSCSRVLQRFANNAMPLKKGFVSPMAFPSCFGVSNMFATYDVAKPCDHCRMVMSFISMCHVGEVSCCALVSCCAPKLLTSISVGCWFLRFAIHYADRLESAGWGGCLRRQMSLGETRQFTRPASPAPGDVTLCVRGGLEAFTQHTQICQGRERRVKVYITIDFASLGPRNYETDILISVADQLLKIQRVFLFWFCVLYWLHSEQRRGFCTGLII